MSKAFDKYYESELPSLFTPVCLDNPEWKKAGRVHDWRNHVPYKLKKVWNELSEEERKVLALMAATKADEEEWD